MSNTLQVVKSYLESPELKKRFNDVLGAKANQFISNMLSTVSGSKSLQGCDPRSIISASLIAASLDLPIDSNLGFAAIVPYKCKSGTIAQFQIMAKGFIQLAIRSGQYLGMNYSEVYEDELKHYDPITKEIEFTKDFKPDSFRETGQEDKIVGYYAWIELVSGFKQSLYMTVNEIKNHAKKYSASYKYDLSKNIRTSKWSTDFDPMAKKTVIKLLLSKWGILSVDMQKAISEDQKIYEEEGGEYLDNDSNTIDVAVNDPFTNTNEETADNVSESDENPKDNKTEWEKEDEAKDEVNE